MYKEIEIFACAYSAYYYRTYSVLIGWKNIMNSTSENLLN